MSLIKKCDVKKYFAAHPRKGRFPLRTESKLGAKGIVAGSFMEHSSSGVTMTPVVTAGSSDRAGLTSTATHPQE
jgi:hypothetical protein